MKLRIGSKMLVGYVIMVTLLLVGGLVTIFYTYRLQAVTSQLLVQNVSSLKAAQELEVALFRMRGLTLNYIVDGDPVWIKVLEERKREALAWLNEAKATAYSTEEKKILAQIATLFSNYEQDLKQALAFNSEGEKLRAKTLLLHASRQVFDNIYQQCELFVSINENDMYAAEERIGRTNKAIRAAMYGLGLGGIILGILLGVIISRSVINPIYELVLKVRGATGNEFVERVNVSEPTELEELDHHVHELIHRINTTTADLQKNRELLAQAEKLATLGRVAAGVAHEIRNPLTAIKMLIYSLQADLSPDDEKSKDLEVIAKEVQRMERFIQNFLQFARPQKPSHRPVEVNAAVRETLAVLAPRIRQFGARLIENYQTNATKIRVDEDQIKQVLMNLIMNALESMPNGGELKVETVPQTDSQNGNIGVQIRITDTGCGIPNELMTSLFDPFVSGRQDGIGLGLSIAHQIVQQHGGQIEAQNNQKGGATFVVTLPYDKAGPGPPSQVSR